MNINIQKRKEIANRNINIGNYLRDIRLQLYLKITELAKSISINVPKSYLNNLENGKITPCDINIRNLALYYNLDEIELFAKYNRVSLTIIESLLSDKTLQREIYNKIKLNEYKLNQIKVGD